MKLKQLPIFIPNNFSGSEHLVTWLLTMISKFEWHLESIWQVPFRINFVLFSFKIILFCVHHCTTLFTSICRPLSMSCISFEELRNVASSAKMSISECLIWRGRSLINSINKRGLTWSLVEHQLTYVFSPMTFFQCELLGCAYVNKIAIEWEFDRWICRS